MVKHKFLNTHPHSKDNHRRLGNQAKSRRWTHIFLLHPQWLEGFRQLQAEHLFQAITLKNGLVMYGSLYGARRQPAFRRGLPAWISPPLSISSDEIHDMMGRLDSALTEWESAVL